MKVKLQLDAKSIQAFLVGNVEKIGFAVVVVLCLLMVYSAVAGMKGDRRKPEELAQAVLKGQKAIDTTTLKIDLPVKDYPALAKKTRERIAEPPYATPAAWTPLLWAPPNLRETPELFKALALRGAAEVGPMTIAVTPAEAAPGAAPAAADAKPAERPGASAAPGGPENPGGMPGGMAAAFNETRLQRWVVLTALVPLQKEELAYAEALQKSVYYDPQTDFPQYDGYYVERVEVPSASEAVEPDWTKAKPDNSYKAVQKAMGRWGQAMTTEVVSSEYVDESLTFPLGPRTAGQWGESAAHAPEIPLFNPNDLRAGMGGLGNGMMPPGMGRMPPGAGMMPPGAGMMPRYPGMMPGNPGMMPPGGGMMPRNPGMMPGAGGMRPRNRGNPGRNPFGEGPTPNPTEPGVGQPGWNGEQKPLPFLLLRYFDYTVEPGKHYVYRVKLVLANPNYIPAPGAADAMGMGMANVNLKPGYLKDPELAKKRWLETEWSEPSPAISTPRDTRVLAMYVNPGREPTGHVMLAKWVERGFEAFHDATVVRGQVINFLDTSFTHNPIVNLPGMGGMGSGGAPAPGAAYPGTGMPGAPGMGAPGTQPGKHAPAARDARGAVPGGPGTAAPAAPGRGAGRGAGRTPPGGMMPGGMMPGGMMPGGMMPGGMMPGGPGAKYKVNYYSQSIAVDFRGGEKVSKHGNLSAPGEILLWEPDGTLSVRNELEDKAAIEQLKAGEAPPAAAAGGAPVPGGAVGPRRGGALDNLLGPDHPDQRRRPTGHGH